MGAGTTKTRVFSPIRKEPKELKFPLPVTYAKGDTQGSELRVRRTLPPEQPRSGCPVRVRPPEVARRPSKGGAQFRRVYSLAKNCCRSRNPESESGFAGRAEKDFGSAKGAEGQG